MPDKILFLDIDGVFIPARAYYMAHQTKELVTQFDPCVVGMVNNLCKYKGYKLVVHSSWLRSSLFTTVLKEFKDVREHMIDQGLLAEYFHEDWAVEYKFSSTRWDGILWWLDDHRDVIQYYVLEDEQCYYTGTTKFDGHIIKTDFNEGLTYAQFQYIYNEDYCDAY